jgi:hypothetical protein
VYVDYRREKSAARIFGALVCAPKKSNQTTLVSCMFNTRD